MNTLREQSVTFVMLNIVVLEYIQGVSKRALQL